MSEPRWEPCWCSSAVHAANEPCPTRDYWLDVEDSEFEDAGE